MQLSVVLRRLEGSQANDGSAEDNPGVRCHPPYVVSVGSDHEVVVRWTLNGSCGAVGTYRVCARDSHRLHVAVQAYGKGGVAFSQPVVSDLPYRSDRAKTDNRASSGHDVSSMKSGIPKRAKGGGLDSLRCRGESKSRQRTGYKDFGHLRA